jgi:anti-sigma factor RsiW
MSHISEARLQAYLDGELSGPQGRRVIDHLDACKACQVRVQALQKLYDRIDSLPDEPLPLDLTPAVLARLTPRTRLSNRARWLLLVELVLGGGALGAALRWLRWSPTTWGDQSLVAAKDWLNPQAVTQWLNTLQAPIRDGLEAFGSLSASATAPLAAALPATGWAAVLGILLVAGLAANGLILVRAGQPRPKEGRSA